MMNESDIKEWTASEHSQLTKYISKMCGCPYRRVYSFKHTCFLKCVHLSHIEGWIFLKGEDQNYSLFYRIAFLMCYALLNHRLDHQKYIEKLENRYNRCLEGLSIIIDEYREWYPKDLKELPEKPKEKEYTSFPTTTVYVEERSPTPKGPQGPQESQRKEDRESIEDSGCYIC